MACSKLCFQKWIDGGKKFIQIPCLICNKEHNILQCPELTPARQTAMGKLFGYMHEFNYFHNINNLASVKNYLSENPQPTQPPKLQAAQRAANFNFTHGKGQVGPVIREIYFDLGGFYNLIDDSCWEVLKEMIATGKLKGARIVTPEEMGYSRKGVPVDVAATEGGTTIVCRLALLTAHRI